MGWKERAETYRDTGSIAGKRDDDFCARKILRGLGWTERGLAMLCMRTGVVYDGAEPLISLVRKILDAVSLGQFHEESQSRRFIMDVRPLKDGKFWGDDEELREYCELASTVPGGLLVFGRRRNPSGNDDCLLFSLVQDSEQVPPWVLVPPALLKERRFGCMAWVLKAEKAVESMAAHMRWDVPKPEDNP